ncbi:MAG: hypothetical protein JJU35_13025 [Balneolales bacterium]|nr:hypothetical protein [Balneolales bacterium]
MKQAPICCAFFTMLGLVLAVLVNPGNLHAQLQGGSIGDTNVRLYTLQGSMSLQTHAYSTTRSSSFRDPLGLLANVNLNYSFLGFRSGLNVRYSTEDPGIRQSMNRYSFQAGWRWMNFSAGDVSPTFNRYSLRGTRVRGGLLEISGGTFGAQFVGGQVNRRIADAEGPSLRRQSYERMLYGGRVRMGRENASHFAFGLVYAYDDNVPLPLPPGADESSFRQPAPQENLTLSPDLNISMFRNRFQIRAENSVSVFTRDMRSEALDLDEVGVPDFMTNFFRPRTSTKATFATNVNTRINIRPLTLNVGFERVQPGYETLGLRNIKDDDQNISVQPQLSLLSGRLGLGSSLRIGRDNLLGQRAATQHRNDYGLNVQAQLTQQLNLGASWNMLINQVKVSSGDDETAEINYPEQQVISQNVSLQPSYSWMSGSNSHSVALSATWQLLDVQIENVDRDLGSQFFTTTGSYNLSLGSGMNINTGLNYAGGSAPSSEFQVLGANIGLGRAFFDRKLNMNLTAGFSQSQSETTAGEGVQRQRQQQLNGNFTAMYRPRRSNTIRLTARNTNNFLLEGSGIGFRELEIRLSIDQRF